MKNIYKLIFGASLAVMALASCSKLNQSPVFDAKESFAAFKVSTYNVQEDCGQLIIPVELASYQPVATNVAYQIVDITVDSTYTAKEGVDFIDTNEDKVLVFDGTTRSMNIVLNIVNHSGEYTGDLKFAVDLVSASGLKLSAEKKVAVTIADLDHPLAAILGEYTVTCKDYLGTTDQDPYVMTISKDAKDVHTVHIDYIVPGAKKYAAWGDWSYVGTVSDDLKTITIARGQETEAYYGDKANVLQLWTYESCDGSQIYGIEDKGTFTATSETPGVFTVNANIWLNMAKEGLYTSFVAYAPVWTKK